MRDTLSLQRLQTKRLLTEPLCCSFLEAWVSEGPLSKASGLVFDRLWAHQCEEGPQGAPRRGPGDLGDRG